MRRNRRKAIIESLERSVQALRKIASKRELPTKFRRDCARFAKKIEVLGGRSREGELLQEKAVLLRQAARLMVVNARSVLRRQRLGLTPDSGLEWRSTAIIDFADYIVTGPDGNPNGGSKQSS
jgi:hypothetical protein